MPPRIAYWISSFEPEMEAIASEVALLRRCFRSSVAWGLTHRRWLLLSWKRGFGLNPRLYLLFRAAVRLLEPAFDLNHIFGSLGDWPYLHAPRRRPTVVTMVDRLDPANRSLLNRVDRFVVEFPSGRETLNRLGVSPDRVRLIYPAVDLKRFSPEPPPPGPFTVLFASSPDRASWLEARGVPPLLEAAALRPRMRFRLLWRPWGDSEPRVRQWIVERGLQNVELVREFCQDMAVHYRQAHVTVAPFTDPNRSKLAPNSLIESLACGRPVLTTEVVGLAQLIREGDAGQVSAATGDALADHLDRLQAGWDGYSARARRLAERWFGIGPFLTAYQQVYEELLGRPIRCLRNEWDARHHS